MLPIYKYRPAVTSPYKSRVFHRIIKYTYALKLNLTEGIIISVKNERGKDYEKENIYRQVNKI